MAGQTKNPPSETTDGSHNRSEGHSADWQQTAACDAWPCHSNQPDGGKKRNQTGGEQQTISLDSPYNGSTSEREQPHEPGEVPKPAWNSGAAGTATDSQGTVFTYNADHSMKVQYKDGTSYTRTPGKDGTYVETHEGPNRKDNFEISFSKDGTSFHRIEKFDQHQHFDLRAEKQHLNELASKQIHDPEQLEKFTADMKKFEARADVLKLGDQEKAKTYSEISRVLAAKGDQPLTEAERTRAARDIMSIAAEPTANNQGNHNTCNLTTIENRTFTREPSVAAGLIADVATTGKYVGKDGTTVQLDKESLTMQPEAGKELPRGKGNVRNYGSQLFQVTAGNLLYVKENESTNPPGDKHYVQGPELPPHDGQPPSTGEKVVDGAKKGSNGSNEETDHFQQKGGKFNEMIAINTMITGRYEPEAFLERKDVSGPGDGQANKFESKVEFESKLAQLKKDGKLPAVIGVHLENDPFYKLDNQPHEMPDGQKVAPPFNTRGLTQDGHVLLITDYDENTHTIKYHNQNGDDPDRVKEPVSVDEFYQATGMQKASVWLDRLEEERKKGNMSENDYAEHLKDIWSTYSNLWSGQRENQAPGQSNAPGTYDQDEVDLATRKHEAALDRSR